jgi:hypothetical protein
MMNQSTSQATRLERPAMAFAAVVVPLIAIYACWLLPFWPGLLDQDMLAVMLEVEGKVSFESGKPMLWYLLVKYLYGTPLRVEFVTGLELLIAAAVCARILSWCWVEGLGKTFWAILISVVFAPHVIFFQSTLYSDGLFALATTGIFFEMWLILRLARIKVTSFFSGQRYLEYC